MYGDPVLGNVLRQIRLSRSWTLSAVARRVGCTHSQLSQVETGYRALKPWLALALDSVYGTGASIAALLEGGASGMLQGSPASQDDVVMVGVHRQDATMPVARRELLAALGVGAVGGTLLGRLHRATESVHVDDALLAELRETFNGLQAASRLVAPLRLIPPLTGQVAFLDTVRRRAPEHLRREFMILQIQFAESASWMAEEAGDLQAALYWVDRVQNWAQLAMWPAMMAYGFVRRSMLAISHGNDGKAAVDQARLALHTPDAPVRVKGLAAKQISFGYALAGQPDPSMRALEQTMRFSERASRESDQREPIVGQVDVGDPDLLALYTATADVYLGGGDSVVAQLTPRMASIANGSRRTHAISKAKLAQAYAHAGEPAAACNLAMGALDDALTVDSLSARSELCRVLPALSRWSARDDVNEVRHRLAPVTGAAGAQSQTP